MVLKKVYRRIRKTIPRLGASKKLSSIVAGKKDQNHHARDDDDDDIEDTPFEFDEKSPQEELREEYQELIRTSYRMVRCLGDDLDSSIGSSYVSSYRYRDQAAAEEDILERRTSSWHACSSKKNFVHQPIEVTHLMDDSDDEMFGLRFSNMAAADNNNAMDDNESREGSSVIFNIDECRDAGTQCLGAPSSSQRDGDNDGYCRTTSRGYF